MYPTTIQSYGRVIKAEWFFLKIVAGSNRLSGYAAATQSAFVKDAIVHPEYTIRGVQVSIHHTGLSQVNLRQYSINLTL